MQQKMQCFFEAEIYQTGINGCIDVPTEITEKRATEKERIKIKGKINGFAFQTTLMPVKNANHRLFVNQAMMRGGKTALEERAKFEIEQDTEHAVKTYPTPTLLNRQLIENQITTNFVKLNASPKEKI